MRRNELSLAGECAAAIGQRDLENRAERRRGTQKFAYLGMSERGESKGTVTFGRRTDVQVSHLHEEAMRSFGHQLFSSDNVLSSESADRPHDLQQIAGIA